MDLTKELLHDVLRERNFLTRPIDSSEKGNIPCVLMEANHFIQNKLSVSVQVFMNHIGCQISDQESEMCSAVQKLEEWTFKLYRERPLEAPDMPPMSPLFLKQALRSQLHFSPLRSWLSAKPCSSELFPVIRISCNKSSKTSWEGEHIQSHKFPICNVFAAQNDLLWLQLEVQWLKREYYIEKMPLCSGKIRHNCNDGLVLDELDFDRQEESNSSSSDSESIISNDSLSDFALPSKWINSAEEDRRQLFGDGQQQQRRLTRREHKKTGKEDKLQMEHGLQQQKRPPLGSQQQLHQQNHRSTCSFSPVPSPALRRRLLQRNNKREETVHNSPKRKTIINKTTNEEVISEGVRASQQCNDGIKTPKSQHSFRRHAPARLVCNFEESILNGRLVPSNTVDGYRLQLTIIPTTSMHFSPQRLTLPVQVCFFDEVMDSVAMSKTPSSLHLAVSEIGSSGIKVPSQCNLQAILFNTQGSVIKIFMVGVDVGDMPPSSNTFIRQRTFSETGSNTTKGTVANQQNNAKTSSMMGPTAINVFTPVARSASSTLRFLIHLRLASDSLGHIRLHTDIRMLFSNKSNDLEGLENVLDSTSHQRSFAANVRGMHSVVQMPDMPKYSPIR